MISPLLLIELGVDGMSLLGRSAFAVSAAGVLAVSGAGVGTGNAHAARDLYGAIAVGFNHLGTAVDFPTQDSADEAAVDACKESGGDTSGCHVETRLHNECGAVLERDIGNMTGSAPSANYYRGTGPTPAAAEQDARSRAGRDYVYDTPLWITRKPLFVLDIVCTANAG